MRGRRGCFQGGDEEMGLVIGGRVEERARNLDSIVVFVKGRKMMPKKRQPLVCMLL